MRRYFARYANQVHYSLEHNNWINGKIVNVKKLFKKWGKK